MNGVSPSFTDHQRRAHALRVLKRKLSEDVSTDTEVCRRASLDNARLSFMPEAVIRPKNDAAIVNLLAIAQRYSVPITPRGAGSAATGATSPRYGGWVLDLSDWNRVRIDALSGMAYVEAGVRTAAVQRAAERRGWFYPPDPSSLEYSTIGGNIACNAGGMRCAKYGVTRDYVYAVEGFLSNGHKVRWAADLKKFASGYNLRDVMIGSEGTLGIITRAVLKLIPKPASKWTALAAFADEAAALGAVKAIARARLVPAILEFLDRQTVYCAEQCRGRPIVPRQPRSALLLIEIDGHPAQVRDDRRRLCELLYQQKVLGCREATTPNAVRALWAVRRTCSQAMFQLGNTKLNEDVVVPLRSQPALLRYTLQLRRRSGLATPTFGHAADGNFHVNIMYNRDEPCQVRAAQSAVGDLMRKVVDLGGAITGEHGIGLAKSAFLNIQHTPAEIQAMRAVKDALDPHHILNPGKIFEPFDVMQHPPASDIRFPWEHS